MLSDLGGTGGLLVNSLPPDGEMPGVAGATETTSISNVSLFSRSKDGKVLMYGVLLTLSEE